MPELEAGESETQGHPWLHSQCMASQGDMNPHLKNQNSTSYNLTSYNLTNIHAYGTTLSLKQGALFGLKVMEK